MVLPMPDYVRTSVPLFRTKLTSTSVASVDQEFALKWVQNNVCHICSSVSCLRLTKLAICRLRSLAETRIRSQSGGNLLVRCHLPSSPAFFELNLFTLARRRLGSSAYRSSQGQNFPSTLPARYRQLAVPPIAVQVQRSDPQSSVRRCCEESTVRFSSDLTSKQASSFDPSPLSTSCERARDSLACLRSADVSVLQAANVEISNSGLHGLYVFAPVIDGKMITQSVTKSLKEGRTNGVRLTHFGYLSPP